MEDYAPAGLDCVEPVLAGCCASFFAISFRESSRKASFTCVEVFALHSMKSMLWLLQYSCALAESTLI